MQYFRVNDQKKYWYWAFASRNDPSTDPVMLWMTGGPGCSSQVVCARARVVLSLLSMNL